MEEYGQPAPIYDNKGRMVGSRPAPANIDGSSWTADSYLAMSSRGDLIRYRSITDHVSYGNTHRLWPIRRAILGVRKGDLERSFRFDRPVNAFGVSWKRDELYLLGPGRIEVLSDTGRVVRKVFIHLTIGHYVLVPIRVWPLPGDRAVLETYLFRESWLDPMQKLPGVPVVTTSTDSYASTHYLSTVDMKTGAVTPLMGFCGLTFDPEAYRYRNRTVVFNNGRSIATGIEGKLYIFEEADRR